MIHKNNLKRYVQFFLIVLAAGAIYPIMYLRTNYQETIIAVFHLNPDQLNDIYSILGLSFVFGYIPSGLISDKFNVKWLIAISLIGTSACGFWFASVPDPQSVKMIFILWGIFSVFTFWSAHMKMVKMLAAAQEQGRFFGILDGGRGVVEALLGTVALAIFAATLNSNGQSADNQAALVAVIRFYSIIVLISAILVILFVEQQEKKVAHTGTPDNNAQAEKFHFTDAISLLGKKSVLLMGSIIFMGYSVYWSIYYLGSFLQNNAGIDALTVSSVMVVVLWMRPVGGFIGGFLADKIGRAITVAGAMLGASALLFFVSAMPVGVPLIYFVITVLGALLYAIRGTFWSLLEQAGIRAAVMGSAIGVISFIGYLPDILLPQINTFFHDVFGAQAGHTAYFLFSAVLGLVGALLVLAYDKVSASSGTGQYRQEINNEFN